MRRYYREELEQQLNKGALWAVTYGDLMSYLMILFLVLFSFSLSKNHKTKETKKYEESLATIQKVFGGKVDPKRLEQMLQKEKEESAAKHLSEDIESKKLSKYVELKVTEEKVRLVLKEPILFDSGKAEIKEGAAPILRDIAQEIQGLTNEVVIEGHTDNVPIHSGPYSSNWELSMARAYAVVRFFESEGVDPKRLSGAGYGEHRPEADNSTRAGRAKNRRIGIVLLRQQ